MIRLVEPRLLALVMAIATLGAQMPAVCVITLDASQPAFTLDICHPAQAVGLAMTPIAASPLHAAELLPWLPERGAPVPVLRQAAGRLGDAPDPPPPEALV